MNKTRRLNRILARDGKALIVAMDHGAIQGPKGLERPGEDTIESSCFVHESLHSNA